MAELSLPALWLFQDAGSMPGDVHIIMICLLVLTALVVALLLGIAIAGLVIYAKVNKVVHVANAKAQPLIAQATPLIGKGREIAAHVNDIVADLKPKIAAVSSDLQPKIAAVTSDLQPKIATISSDVQHVFDVVRSKADEAGYTFSQLNQTVQRYNETAQDVNARAQGQVARVNEMVSEALTTTQHVSKQIQHGIKVPIEKIASLVMAAKSGIENLSEKFPFFQGGAQQAPPRAYGTSKPASGRPGPVPVQPGVRVVHSAEDEARLRAEALRNPTPGKLQ